MRYLIFLLALLLPSGGFAASWKTCDDEVAQGTVTVGGALCVDFLTADLTADGLFVGQCGTEDYRFNPDTGGTDTSTSVIVYSCMSPTYNTNNCHPIAGLTLSGTSPNTEIYGANERWIYAVASGAGAGDEPRLKVECNLY